MIKIMDTYFPGIIGGITKLHAEYYSKNWDFDLYFESKVATELSEFLNRFDKTRDGIWTAHVNDEFVGSIILDGINSDGEGARLRWFILDPNYQGRGIGNLLMEKAFLFCREKNYRRVFLWTFAGLDAARYLYEKFGFTICKEHEDNQWGKKVTEQMFEIFL
jgi:GNAT superfamily N-acetyltransferase